jgi:hypothetical protein
MATAEGPRYMALLPLSTLFFHRTQAVGAAERRAGKVKLGLRTLHAATETFLLASSEVCALGANPCSRQRGSTANHCLPSLTFSA